MANLYRKDTCDTGQQSRKNKHIKILTSREKWMQNAANPTGYSAMKTLQSIIGRQSPQTAFESLGVLPKTQKGNLNSEGWRSLKFSARPTW